MTFSPINEDHALETIRFSVTLSEVIGRRSLQAIKDARGLWAETLPASIDEIVTLNMASGAVDVPGVSFAFLQPNGTPTWQLQIAGVEVEIICTLYTRWAKVWSRVADHLRDTLACVGTHQNGAKVIKAEMTVNDAFYSSNANYELAQLLKKTDCVPMFIFAVGTVWHSRSGWFEGEQPRRMLHNMDLESFPVGNDQTKVQLKHFMRCATDVEVKSQKANQNLVKGLTEKFTAMHEQNKMALERMLTDEFVKKINLRDNT